MSIRSQIIFAQAQAIHVRSVKLRDHSRSEIHVTGPTCNACTHRMHYDYRNRCEKISHCIKNLELLETSSWDLPGSSDFP